MPGRCERLPGVQTIAPPLPTQRHRQGTGSVERYSECAVPRGRGGVGRRARFRSWYPKGCVGSNPTVRTETPGHPRSSGCLARSYSANAWACWTQPLRRMRPLRPSSEEGSGPAGSRRANRANDEMPASVNSPAIFGPIPTSLVRSSGESRGTSSGPPPPAGAIGRWGSLPF